MIYIIMSNSILALIRLFVRNNSNLLQSLPRRQHVRCRMGCATMHSSWQTLIHPTRIRSRMAVLTTHSGLIYLSNLVLRQIQFHCPCMTLTISNCQIKITCQPSNRAFGKSTTCLQSWTPMNPNPDQGWTSYTSATPNLVTTRNFSIKVGNTELIESSSHSEPNRSAPFHCLKSPHTSSSTHPMLNPAHHQSCRVVHGKHGSSIQAQSASAGNCVNGKHVPVECLAL